MCVGTKEELVGRKWKELVSHWPLIQDSVGACLAGQGAEGEEVLLVPGWLEMD